MPPAAKNLFEKRFLDFQKLFIKVFFIALFLSVSSRAFAVYKNPTMDLRSLGLENHSNFDIISFLLNFKRKGERQ